MVEEYQDKKNNKVEMWLTDRAPKAPVKKNPPVTAQPEDNNEPF